MVTIWRYWPYLTALCSEATCMSRPPVDRNSFPQNLQGKVLEWLWTVSMCRATLAARVNVLEQISHLYWKKRNTKMIRRKLKGNMDFLNNSFTFLIDTTSDAFCFKSFKGHRWRWSSPGLCRVLTCNERLALTGSCMTCHIPGTGKVPPVPLLSCRGCQTRRKNALTRCGALGWTSGWRVSDKRDRSSGSWGRHGDTRWRGYLARLGCWKTMSRNQIS